ncbi:PH domain-containing protein (plasmid) [Aquimarina sp. TRL1]|uniref:PH domain-containing protein n=1 Tax=Aquimarina sp. (strain TRL1) TaxID=2736252 RepID=UPI00158D7A62|nr:PH domain-containing protein [Aquimarina sp. TRL1]QKX07723.1 PH domain-containing protein [Aquimarina sp. TRL1]
MYNLSTGVFSARNTTEQIVWSGSSTQLTNFKHYFTSGLLAFFILMYFSLTGTVYVLFALLVPLFVVVWSTLSIKYTVYVLTNERIVKQHGILDRHIYEIELYRVKDVHLHKPFFLRIFRFGNIQLITSQKSTENFILPGIKDSNALREQIRKMVEERRLERGVREFDTN